MRKLCAVHARRGTDYSVGLGFYAFLRFHVDTHQVSPLGRRPEVAATCPPIIRPVDVASVGQPVTPPVAATALSLRSSSLRPRPSAEGRVRASLARASRDYAAATTATLTDTLVWPKGHTNIAPQAKG